MKQDSIFTKIIKGEIPCYKVYEDSETIAFLDIHPIQPGQVLVVPKKQIQFVWDLDDALYHKLMTTAHKVAKRLQEVFPEKKRIGMHIEGLDVDHAHIKVFPFDTDQEYRFHPDQMADPNHDELAEIAKKLAF